jgi:hypothetical protein
MKKIIAALAAVLLLAGCAASPGAGSAQPVNVSSGVVVATPTTSKMPTAPATPATPVSQTKEKAPESCLTAIKAARGAFNTMVVVLGSYGDIVRAIPDALTAASVGDTSGIESFTQVLRDANQTMAQANDSLDLDTFRTSAAECESGG